MMEILLILCGAALLFLLYLGFFHKRKSKAEKEITFVCRECGERHCICTREEDNP